MCCWPPGSRQTIMQRQAEPLPLIARSEGADVERSNELRGWAALPRADRHRADQEDEGHARQDRPGDPGPPREGVAVLGEQRRPERRAALPQQAIQPELVA